jgi:hypothetical protein
MVLNVGKIIDEKAAHSAAAKGEKEDTKKEDV